MSGGISQRKARMRFPAALMIDPMAENPKHWNCRHGSESSDIESYVMESGSIEVIARTRRVLGIEARATAEFIVHAANAHEKNRKLIADLLDALELAQKGVVNIEIKETAARGRKALMEM